MSDSIVIAAATLIVVRDRAGAHPELLMIQRAATMRFGADAWVFPGGRVDPGDHDLAVRIAAPGADLTDLAARIAAIRETIEEAGLPVALEPIPDAAALATLRAGLHGGQAFADLLDAAGLTLRPDRLVPFSRWMPPMHIPRRFDTRFYLVPAPEEAVIAADGQETVALDWVGADDMLTREQARLLFPTSCNLRRIAAYPTFADLAAHAALFPDSFVVTEIREEDGTRWLCVPDGHGYPDIRERMEGMNRG